MQLAVSVWEQRGDLMSFQDECIMAAKYMMNSGGVSSGLKVSHAWRINNSDYYFGYTDYSSPFTYMEQAASVPTPDSWIPNGTSTLTGLKSTKSKKTYPCYGKIINNKAQYPLFVSVLSGLWCYYETIRYDINDGYVYQKIINYYAFTDLPKFEVSERNMVAISRYYGYIKPWYENTFFLKENDKGTGVEKQLVGTKIPGNYKTTTHIITNTRYTTDPGLEEAFLDEYGTWTVRSEQLPKTVDEVTTTNTSSEPSLFPSGTMCTKNMSIEEAVPMSYDLIKETSCISEMHFDNITKTITTTDNVEYTYVNNGKVDYVRENPIIGLSSEIGIEPEIKGSVIITGDWLK